MSAPDLNILFPTAMAWTRRGWLAAALAVAVTPGCVSTDAAEPPRVLFVCEAGTVKSPIARELFLRRADERGISVGAFSRGLSVEDHVSAELARRLAADGIDTRAVAAQALAPEDWRSALIVVAFNPLPNSVDRTDIVDWTDLGSMNDDYDRSLSDLSGRIDRLLDELEARGLVR